MYIFLFLMLVVIILFIISLSNNKKENTDNSTEEKRIMNSYEQELKINKLREGNECWQNEFDKCRKKLEAAEYLEKRQLFIEAINEYLEAIEFAKQSKKLIFENYAFYLNRVIILYGKTKQIEKLRKFLVELIDENPNSRDIDNWKIRLSKLDNKDKNIKDSSLGLSPSDIPVYIPHDPTIGKQIQILKKSMPEFDFYHNTSEIDVIQIFKCQQAKELSDISDLMKKILNSAKLAETEGEILKAIDFYNRLVLEEYEKELPYERLMILYRKLKWKNKEIEITENAISFFSNLRKAQYEYITTLAKKYNSEEKANEYILNESKIFYYTGFFELYNPYKKIEKWIGNLEKNNSKSRIITEKSSDFE